MNTPIAFNLKVEFLRNLEVYTYQMVYYLLENEALATKAAMTALLEVSRRDEFFILPSSSQLAILKKTAIARALAVKQSNHAE
ncbi:hypothetical protein [Paenibacillus beijingensis]|nr:hypothetical protein [Paenibacillus beijingensis]